jgi:hypothetical protein
VHATSFEPKTEYAEDACAAFIISSKDYPASNRLATITFAAVRFTLPDCLFAYPGLPCAPEIMTVIN